MKRLFAWLIMSLMGITAVMPSFIPFAKQDETPAVVQIEKESEDDTPTVVPDEPIPTPDIPTPEEETEEELGEVIPYSEAISSTTAFDNFVAQKTAELNAGIYETLKVPTTSEDYRGNELPSGYTQIEYLESTGTQRIDTGVIPTNTMKFVLESNFTSGAMGSSVASSSKTIFDFRSSAVLTYGEGKSHTYTKRNQKQRFIIDYLNLKTACDEYENNFASTPNFGNSTFTIFTWHEYGYYYKTSGKFYSLKIYDNDAIVRDFVPCYDSNKVFGLYDVVGNQFYTNQGTGIFNSAGMTTYTNSLQGSGTEEDPYQIADFYDLEYMRKISGYNNGKHYILTNDIIFNDGKFVENEETGIPEYHVGKSGELVLFSNLGNMNNCHLNGDGHKIIGFYGANLFNQFNNGAITDLHFENAYCSNQTNNASTHALVANNVTNTTIENCTTDGWANGAYGTNTLVYYATNSTFKNCINYANNIGDPNQYHGGGIVGNASNCTFDRCENYGKIKSNSGSNCVGGIVGKASNCKISNCKNYGEIGISGHGGGITFWSCDGTIIENCQNYGKANAGFSGETVFGQKQDAIIKNCQNYGECNYGIITTWGERTSIDKGTVVNCENYGKCQLGIGICYSISGCKNYCLLQSGTVYGVGKATTIQNCINYANVENASSFTGIGSTNQTSGKVLNCVNYGNANMTGWSSGVASQSFMVEGCVNYGNLCNQASYSGIYAVARDCKNVRYCKNYGNLYAVKGGTSLFGIGGTESVENCINFGNIVGINGGTCGITNSANCVADCVNNGTILANSSGVAGIVAYAKTVKNCVNNGNVTCRYGGGIAYNAGITNFVIENCVNNGKISGQYVAGILGFMEGGNYSGVIKNCLNNGESQFGGIGGYLQSSGNVRVVNCLNFGDCRTNGFVASKKASVTIENCISFANINKTLKKEYYGSDFSAFYVKWKTGYIGLKALDSVGVYMFAIPSEEYLQERGFTKVA